MASIGSLTRKGLILWVYISFIEPRVREEERKREKETEKEREREKERYRREQEGGEEGKREER